MKHLTEDLGQPDRDGVIHIGRNTRGCRHCGHTDMKYSQNGRVCLHHPGTTCCLDAVKDQIRYRTEELEALRDRLRQAATEIEDAQRKAAQAVGKEAADLNTRVARMQTAYDIRAARLKPEADDLKREIAELNSLLRVAA